MNIRRYLLWTFLLICVMQTRGLDGEPTDEDYSTDTVSYDYENYEGSKEFTASTSDTSSPKVETELPPSTTPSYTTSTSTTTTTTAKSEESSCPANCKCSDIFEHTNCANQMLKTIPENVPTHVVYLDLSSNDLNILNVTELNRLTELRELNLRSNQITKIIESAAFEKLKKLHFIDLSNNSLDPLQGNEFSKLSNLAHLNLSSNKNIIESKMLMEPTKKLKILDMSNCNIVQLEDNIFENVSSLVVLNLRDNPLDKNINVNAFKYLINLRTLQLPIVAKENILDLCKALKSTDVINMEGYDLSCFFLTSGLSFDESTIKIGQSTLIPADTDDLYKTITNATPVIEPMRGKKTTKSSSSPGRTTGEIPLMIEEPKVQSSGQQMSTVLQVENRNMNITNETNVNDSTKEIEQSRVDIPIGTIHILLTGLIVLTLLALSIGIICRLDCCGIKTKCCRTGNSRATTQDHNQPHEEIPLNKV